MLHNDKESYRKRNANHLYCTKKYEDITQNGSEITGFNEKYMSFTKIKTINNKISILTRDTHSSRIPVNYSQVLYIGKENHYNHYQRSTSEITTTRKENIIIYHRFDFAGSYNQNLITFLVSKNDISQYTRRNGVINASNNSTIKGFVKKT